MLISSFNSFRFIDQESIQLKYFLTVVYGDVTSFIDKSEAVLAAVPVFEFGDKLQNKSNK